MSDFVNTTFSGADNTNITAITGSQGETYTGTGNGLYLNTNRLVPRFSNICLYQASNAPATAEYDVTAVVNALGLDSSMLVGPMGRYLDANGNGYAVLINGDGSGSGRIRLFSVISYDYTAQFGSTYSLTYAVNTPFTVKLEIRTAAKKVYLDGSEIITTSDDSITQTGLAGVTGFNGNGNDNSVLALVSLVATNVGGGASSWGAQLSDTHNRLVQVP